MIDRSVDLITPFLRQNTYEGLLDETFGIECGAMTVKRTIVTPDTEETIKQAAAGKQFKEKVTMRLSNEDSLFKTIRDGTIPMLGTKTRELTSALKQIK
jgi:hypothetical protein